MKKILVKSTGQLTGNICVYTKFCAEEDFLSLQLARWLRLKCFSLRTKVLSAELQVVLAVSDERAESCS